MVHTWKPETNSHHCCYLLPNGHLLRPGDLGGREKSFGGGPGALGRVQEFTWEGEVVWDYTFFNDKQLPHHDICKMPNGNVLMIVWDKKNVDECIAAGRKKELVSKYVLPDSVVEVKPTGKNSGEIVWEWHLWDHLIQDHDSTKANYGVVAEHPELVDVNYVKEEPPPPAAPKDAAKKEAAAGQKPAQAKSKAELDRLKSIGYAGSAASLAQKVEPRLDPRELGRLQRRARPDPPERPGVRRDLDHRPRDDPGRGRGPQRRAPGQGRRPALPVGQPGRLPRRRKGRQAALLPAQCPLDPQGAARRGARDPLQQRRPAARRRILVDRRDRPSRR